MNRPSSAGRQRDEQGSVSLFLIVVLLAVFAVFGLVVDGGARLDAQRRATNQAEQAARAAAEQIDPTSLRTAGPTRLLPAAARQAAAQYLAAAGNLTLTSLSITGNAVTVHVSITISPAVLSLIGLHALTVSGTGHAQLLRGDTTVGSPS